MSLKVDFSLFLKFAMECAGPRGFDYYFPVLLKSLFKHPDDVHSSPKAVFHKSRLKESLLVHHAIFQFGQNMLLSDIRHINGYLNPSDHMEMICTYNDEGYQAYKEFVCDLKGINYVAQMVILATQAPVHPSRPGLLGAEWRLCRGWSPRRRRWRSHHLRART